MNSRSHRGPEASAAGATVPIGDRASALPGAEQWLGQPEPGPERRPDRSSCGFMIIGTAHGPGLLERLRN